MYSRIHNKCHTIQQVIAGGIIGLILGNTFFNYKERLSGNLYQINYTNI